MTQQDERQVIYKALEAYGKNYDAEYYCVILTPDEGQKITIPVSGRIFIAKRGEVGEIIDRLVEKEVLSLPTER